MAVDTKKVEGRRSVNYGSLSDLRADVDVVDAAHREGRLRALGNWSAGQVMDHIARLIECSVDGFPSKAPAPVRWILTLLYKKKALSGGAMPAGFKIPKQAEFLKPEDDVSFEAGRDRLVKILDRIAGGERMTHASPIFGDLSHEEWEILQCGHAGMHMSFLAVD